MRLRDNIFDSALIGLKPSMNVSPSNFPEPGDRISTGAVGWQEPLAWRAVARVVAAWCMRKMRFGFAAKRARCVGQRIGYQKSGIAEAIAASA
jgi:hypothetical protein